MKNKISPAAIGMFVISAAVIAVAAVMIFGAAKFFSKTEMFISFFSESLNGLDVGAPLKYKGVKIGKVEGIFINSPREIKDSKVSVVYSIDVNMLKRRTGHEVKDFDEWIEEQIAQGLRAKLKYQSIVTGMLYIELDFVSNKDEKYELFYGGKRFKEIPAENSGLAEMAKGIENMMANISKIDFASISENLNKVLITTNTKLNDLDTKAISDNTKTALEGINNLVRNKKIEESFKKLDTLLTNSNELVKDINRNSTELTKRSEKTLANADEVMKNINTVVSPQSPFRYELAQLIKSLTDSMNSISNLADYIQRNPQSILTGKGESENAK